MYSQITYISRPREDISLAECRRMVRNFQWNNTEQGISGILLFNSLYFIQTFEGEEASVNTLYEKILKDPRHHSISLLYKKSIDKRLFEKWAMCLVTPNEGQFRELLELQLEFIGTPVTTVVSERMDELLQNLSQQEVLSSSVSH